MENIPTSVRSWEMGDVWEIENVKGKRNMYVYHKPN